MASVTPSFGTLGWSLCHVSTGSPCFEQNAPCLCFLDLRGSREGCIPWLDGCHPQSTRQGARSCRLGPQGSLGPGFPLDMVWMLLGIINVNHLSDPLSSQVKLAR